MTEFRNLGPSGLRVSPICLGAMNFGTKDWGCDEETSLSIIDSYLGAGHNFIDTANRYSDTLSETIVGKALKGRRDSVVLATKAGNAMGEGPHEVGTSRKHLMNEVEGSLRRLQTDYIDLYQMHRYDPLTPMEETLSTLNDLVRSGKVRYIGVSNWTASQITEAALLCRFKNWENIISLQPRYSLIAREIEVEIVPTCLRFGIGIIPFSPLGSGVLTGKYKRGEAIPAGTRLDSLAGFRSNLTEKNFQIVDTVSEEAAKLGTTPIALSIAWNMQRPGIVAPIIGPRSEEHLAANIAALDLKVPQETLDRITEVSEPEWPYPNNLPYMRVAKPM